MHANAPAPPVLSLQENEDLRATLAVAEATAAAATAELLQTRSGLTRLQSSRAMKTHRLAEGIASVRRVTRSSHGRARAAALVVERAIGPEGDGCQLPFGLRTAR